MAAFKTFSFLNVDSPVFVVGDKVSIDDHTVVEVTELVDRGTAIKLKAGLTASVPKGATLKVVERNGKKVQKQLTKT